MRARVLPSAAMHNDDDGGGGCSGGGGAAVVIAVVDVVVAVVVDGGGGNDGPPGSLRAELVSAPLQATRFPASRDSGSSGLPSVSFRFLSRAGSGGKRGKRKEEGG